MLPGLFPIMKPLKAGSGLTEVFRQARNRFSTLRFVLHAIDPDEDAWCGVAVHRWRGKACDDVEANRGRDFAWMG